MYLIKISDGAVENARQLAKENGESQYVDEIEKEVADAKVVKEYLTGYSRKTHTYETNAGYRLEIIPSLATGYENVTSDQLPQGVSFVSEVKGGRSFIRNVQRWVAEMERGGKVGKFDSSKLM